MSVLTLPGDNGTWSVVLTTASRDRHLHALREPDRWDAALARYPLAAHWRDGEPITGVDVMAGLEDRHRRLVVDGVPVATGVVAVGDAWACTNPSLGRGASIGLLHACVLRDVLRDVDSGDVSGDPEKLVRRFDEVTAAVVEPLYRTTLWFDRNRLAEIAADAGGGDGASGGAGDPRWAASKALFAASLADQDLIREYLSVALLLSPADEVFGLAGRGRAGDAARRPRPAVPAARAEPAGTARRHQRLEEATMELDGITLTA